MTKLAVLTIGQSPRVDLIPDMKKVLGEEIDIVEYGILDKFKEEEAIKLLKPLEGDTVLVSRLNSGKEIVMSEEKVYPLVQEYISYIEAQNIDNILLLCTGKFPDFNFKGMLIKPFDIVHSVVKGLANSKKVGLIVPDENQIENSLKLWKDTGVEGSIKFATPYDKDTENLGKIAEDFKDEDIPFIVLDCMGYSTEMKKIVQERSGKPVILSRTIIARVVKELFC